MEPRNLLFKKLSSDLNSAGPWSTFSVVRFYNPGISLNLKSLSMVLGPDGEESACNVEDLGSISGLEKFPGAGNSYPLWYSCLENSMDSEAWQAAVHGVVKSQTGLSDYHFSSLKIA